MSDVKFGNPHRHLRRCESTNSVARALAAAGAPAGTVVTADLQSAGRGRQGRSWFGGKPGTVLAYSALHRDREIAPLLSLATAVASCEAVARIAPVEPRAKWPNDILIEGRKCAGILIEGRPQQGWAVIGIGINLATAPEEFPAEIRDRATSVGHGVTPDEARQALDESLSTWVGADRERLLDAFAEIDALRGRTVTWAGRSGTAVGVDSIGRLILEAEGGEIERLSAGEVHLDPIRPAGP